MKQFFYLTSIFYLLLICACDQGTSQKSSMSDSLAKKDTVAVRDSATLDSMLDKKDSLSLVVATDNIKADPLNAGESIDVQDLDPEELIEFAETLVGTPYVYGSSDP